MTTINLSLPEDLNRFIESQVRGGGFGGASDYIQTLIARAKSGNERIEALLIEGLDSGEPIQLDAETRQTMRSQMRDALAE
jgi:antitoxin ParD1/3/4